MQNLEDGNGLAAPQLGERTKQDASTPLAPLEQVIDENVLKPTKDVGVPRSYLAQAWGVFGVAAYLAYGVMKILPVVQSGIFAIDQRWQWFLLASTLGFFAYTEGYKGFQKGFSPRVVRRAWIVSEKVQGSSAGTRPPIWHKIIAPAFCIGYFHGTRRRVIASWIVTTIIFLVVIGVKWLANPYRAIIDAGVLVGLTWGIMSTVIIFLRSIWDGKPPCFDPALPNDTPYTVS